jgi:predicted outer membrane repeat protein
VGLTIRNGSGSVNNNGGAVNILAGGLLTVNDCAFIDNDAATGGAIYALDCDVTVSNSQFTNNSATNIGGAIRTNRGELIVTGSNFQGNAADGTGGAIQHNGNNAFSVSIADTVFESNTTETTGGAVYSAEAPSLTLEGVDFLNNVTLGTGSQDTGGVFIAGTPSTLVLDCDFERNLCPGSGGALRFSNASGDVINTRFIDNEASSGGAVQVVGALSMVSVFNSVFDGNSARRPGSDSATGGGAMTVSQNGSRLDVYNSLFVNNTAVTGGAITAFDAGVLNVYNSTMVGNDADALGGAIRRSSASAAVTVNNSVFTGNLPFGSQVAINGSGTDFVNFSIVEGGYTEPGVGTFDADPMFVNASAGDYRLMPGSPAIDAGSSSRYLGGPFSDLAGGVRVTDDPDTVDAGEAIFGAVIDIGAYEFQTAGGPVDTCPTDTNGDGVINFTDLNAILSVFGTDCDG